MLKIDSDKTIRITRGDAGVITITATSSDGSNYEFANGDVVRFKVFKKKDVTNVVLKKDITIDSTVTEVDINLNSEDTHIGEYINKPVVYWYEVEINPDYDCKTIIGYDEDGPKQFIIYPESKNEVSDGD